MGCKTGYKDTTGREYKLNDIVLNPFFGDLWLVKEYTDEELTLENTTCRYYFAQYGNPDNYYMDIDEPEGFKIICSEEDENYWEVVKEMKQIDEQIRKEMM